MNSIIHSSNLTVMDWRYCGLLVAVVIFIVSLIVFFDRISRHAIDGNGFYDYNQVLRYHQRSWEDSGTPLKPWMMDHETNKQCPPAYCSPPWKNGSV